MDRQARHEPHVATQLPPSPPKSFLSVAEAARLLGMSSMTLYRAIAAGDFPAVKIRGRVIIPARALDQMVEASLLDGGQVINAADWVAEVRPR